MMSAATGAKRHPRVLNDRSSVRCLRTTVCLVAAALVAASCSGGGQAVSGESPGAESVRAGANVTVQKNPRLAKTVPSKVRKRGTLVVGSAAESPPDEFLNKKGKLVGWEVDMMSAIAETLGLSTKFKTGSFDSLIPGLQARRFDAAIGQFGVTKKRLKVVDFVTEASANEKFAALSSTHGRVESLDDLCGRTVSTVRGSREQEFAAIQNKECVADGKPKIDLKIFQDGNSAGLSVMSQRSEYFWLGETAVRYFVKKSNGKAKIVGSYLKPNPLGIALPKDSAMTSVIHNAIQDLIDKGVYAKILKKWGLAHIGIKESRINPSDVTQG